MAGRLVLVGTPLGNREDLSPRARRSILEADLLLCEDTRSPTRLLGAEVRLPSRLSCFAGNESARIEGMLAALAADKCVVFVSEAGMPAWSDPGRALVDAAANAGYEVDVVPGPTAAATALCHAGFAAKGARFLGFPPRDTAGRRALVASINADMGACLLYEAGNRTPALFAQLVVGIDDAATRRAIVARELTKMHQEVLRGTVAELADRLQESLRGEVTVVIEGRRVAIDQDEKRGARDVLDVMLDPELKPRPKAKRLAELTGVDASTIYDRIRRARD